MRMVLFLIVVVMMSIIPASFAQTISIQTNKEQFIAGDTVEINGIVENGISGEHVAIEIKNPDGETILIRTVTLNDGGSFYLKFKIPESGKTGSYEIVANVNQNGNTITETKTITQELKTIEKTTSEPKPSSKGGGCLIATATFDSELAPQVQKLREIRDSKLLQTESGTGFMESFNSFYYSFSPAIADYERENPIFKEMVKIGITPMLSTLSLMDYAETESEVLTIGISLIVLNGMMYVGLPVFGIMIAKKRF